MSLQIVIEQLDRSHDRTAFDCGVPALDVYLREQAGQDVKRRIGNCFVARDSDAGLIAGYYTLAATGIPISSLPEAETRRLPRYPVLPATLVGRLAIDLRYRRRGIGSVLLVDALKRTASAAPAAFALVVEAKDEDAVAFYVKHGSIRFESRPMALFLPVATALRLFGA